MPASPSTLDPRGARFAQGIVGVLALAAFVLDARALVLLTALLLTWGAAAGPARSPLSLLWARAIVPGLRLGAPARRKDAAPVRFAQGLGAVFLVAATALLYAPIAWPLSGLVAWVLTLAVSALAILAAATDVCVGCEMYAIGRKLALRRGARA